MFFLICKELFLTQSTGAVLCVNSGQRGYSAFRYSMSISGTY